MGLLNTEQRQLLLDHCIGVATHQQSEDARQLISSNPAAAKLVDLFERKRNGVRLPGPHHDRAHD